MRKLIAALSLSLLLAGCAQGDDPTVAEDPLATSDVDAAPTDEAASPSGETKYNDKGTETFTDTEFDVAVELDNFYFEPTFIKSPGGATAMITLTNEGDVPHTFTVEALDVDEELQPGDSREIEVAIGTETRYEFSCRFHEGQGMRGAFQPH
jgi:plastocyanin